MKVSFNGKYSYFLTQFTHYVMFDIIWKIIEIIISGKAKESLSDAITLSVICIYITWILGKEVTK